MRIEIPNDICRIELSWSDDTEIYGGLFVTRWNGERETTCVYNLGVDNPRRTQRAVRMLSAWMKRAHEGGTR